MWFFRFLLILPFRILWAFGPVSRFGLGFVIVAFSVMLAAEAVQEADVGARDDPPTVGVTQATKDYAETQGQEVELVYRVGFLPKRIYFGDAEFPKEIVILVGLDNNAAKAVVTFGPSHRRDVISTLMKNPVDCLLYTSPSPRDS